MKQLTVIIIFLNEGNEVYNTVKSIRDTVGNRVNVIMVNDGSYDGYDYEDVAHKFGAMYISHQTRKGIASSRDEAIDVCPTDFFCYWMGICVFLRRIG